MHRTNCSSCTWMWLTFASSSSSPAALSTSRSRTPVHTAAATTDVQRNRLRGKKHAYPHCTVMLAAHKAQPTKRTTQAPLERSPTKASAQLKCPEQHTRGADGAAIPLQPLDWPRPLVEVVAPAQKGRERYTGRVKEMPAACLVASQPCTCNQEQPCAQKHAASKHPEFKAAHRLPVHCRVAVMECRRNLVCRSCSVSSICRGGRAGNRVGAGQCQLYL